MAQLLKIEALHFRQAERAILTGIDLVIDAGEVHALLGANGAGKSSLAYLTMGCEGYRPSAGSILFEGETIEQEPLHRRAQRGISLAWQEPARFEGLTVGDYLALGKPKRGAAECLQALGLAPREYLARPLDRTLSGGERKRIELAAMLALEPKLAILDEPAAGARGHVDCVEIVRGKAVVSANPVVRVTHPEAKVTHEAAIGSVDHKQLETLMARGLDPEEAVGVVVRGMLK